MPVVELNMDSTDDGALDDLMDLLTYECPVSGKRRTAGVSIFEPVKAQKCLGI